jgi:hypothetical protein
VVAVAPQLVQLAHIQVMVVVMVVVVAHLLAVSLQVVAAAVLVDMLEQVVTELMLIVTQQAEALDLAVQQVVVGQKVDITIFLLALAAV